MSVPPYAGIYFNLNTFNSSSIRWLPQVSLSSKTTLNDCAARTALVQTFSSHSLDSSIPSATYTFPLYESCAVVAFRCRIGTRLIEGVVEENRDANAKYQDALRCREPASLLEQNAPDVFTTCLGNVPSGETVYVEIDYIMELKHDAALDALRFTIPTGIAPRYGEPPGRTNFLRPYRAVKDKGIDISVEINMTGNITCIQSPSHCISTRLGGHAEDMPADAFNPQIALTKLRLDSMELGTDFVLHVSSVDLTSPQALLETHPTIPNARALMVTLVPRFRPPAGPRPEVVFVVDRSGSMLDRVQPLRAALLVFLKSLPLDVNFNVCSFGSRCSFLWEQSRPYSDETLRLAEQHVATMNANYGGTELLPPIQALMERRHKDLMLEIMVLTDGKVWQMDELFAYAEKATAKGDVRIFSLGIGKDVSHALVDGLARVGKGFSQVIVHEQEGMEDKISRMLSGALSTHISDCRLEWTERPSEAQEREREARGAPPTVSTVAADAARRISLFDVTADADAPPSFTALPSFVVPRVLQAPYKLPPLFPFSRYTAYAILAAEEVAPVHSVWLRANAPSGDVLELEIPVTHVSTPGCTVHQLAARRILQELKEGTGYLHAGRICGVSRQSHPGSFDEWVRREGVRVGLLYSIASEWTSFLAVTRSEVLQESPASTDTSGAADASDAEDDESDGFETIDHGAVSEPSGSSQGGNNPYLMAPIVMRAEVPPPPPLSYPNKSTYSRSKNKKFGSSLWSHLMHQGSPVSARSATAAGAGGGVKDEFETVDSRAFVDSPRSPWSMPSLNSFYVDKKFESRFSGTSSPPETHESSIDYHRVPLRHAKRMHVRVASTQASKAAPPLRPLLSPRPLQPWLLPRLYPSKVETYDPTITFEETTPNELRVEERGATRGEAVRSSASKRPPPMQKRGFFRMLPGSKSSLWEEQSLNAAPPGSSPPPDDLFSSPGVNVTHSRYAEDSAPSIISYTPKSMPPASRLSSFPDKQKPLSEQARTLIGLQTFEGAFTLDAALAALLGVPLSALETRLSSVFPGLQIDAELRRRLWATRLAVALFETRFAEERAVWELVVSKARAWMNSLTGVSTEDLAALDTMVSQALGA